MSKHSRDVELLRQNYNDAMVQYEELLCLRAELARLLFPLKISPPRKCKVTRRTRGESCSSRCRSALKHRPPFLAV